jgi:hypothetical protein
VSQSGSPHRPPTSAAAPPPSSSESAQPAPSITAWRALSPAGRKLVLSALALAPALLVVAGIAYAQQDAPGGITEAIRYPPLIVTALAYTGLVCAAIALGLRSGAASGVSGKTFWLGVAWLLASVPLVLDILLDTFELKLLVIALFLAIGITYWRGNQNSSLALFVAPFMVIVVVGDGLSHLVGGSFCGEVGIQSCSVKAVSDIYLFMIMLVLTFLTLYVRDRMPSLPQAAVVTVLLGLVVLGGALN